MSQPQVTITTNVPKPGERGRKVDGLLRELMQAEAEFHQKEHTKAKFQKGASQKRGYKKRSSRYVKQKRRITGQAQPMVFSGATRESMQQNYKITKTSTKGAKLNRVAAFKGGSGRFRLQKGTTTLSRQQEVALQLVTELKVVLPEEIEEVAQHGAEVWNDLAETKLSAGQQRKLI